MINHIQTILHKKRFKEFFLFCMIGLLGTAINITITYLVTEYLHVRYIISNIIGQLLGITSNFLLNKYKNFNKREGSFRRQYLLSLISYSIGIIISLSITYLLTEMTGMWYIYSIAISIVFVSVINFISHKFIVFKK